MGLIKGDMADISTEFLVFCVCFVSQEVHPLHEALNPLSPKSLYLEHDSLAKFPAYILSGRDVFKLMLLR